MQGVKDPGKMVRLFYLAKTPFVYVLSNLCHAFQELLGCATHGRSKTSNISLVMQFFGLSTEMFHQIYSHYFQRAMVITRETFEVSNSTLQPLFDACFRCSKLPMRPKDDS
jgi:hypothetical protein